ncbi:hypothetical protein JCM16358_09350 [Halanaerocella petrolearia]
MHQETGFTLLEVMVGLAIIGVIFSTLVTVNQSIVKVWQHNKLQTNLEQELRVSMNSIINYLDRALYIKQIADNRIKFIDQDLEEKELFYQSGVGLCLNSDLNLISHHISNFNCQLVRDDLLVVELKITDQDMNLSLKTAVKLTDKQFP